MAISLLDIKNGQSVKRKDEEEFVTSSTQPTISSPNQTISLGDIRSGKRSIKPLAISNAEINKEDINTTTPNADGYTNTGKKFGDYYYQEYATKGNYNIYSKDNNYYYYDEEKKVYKPFGNQNWMTTKEQADEEYKEAVKAGYKGSKDTLKVLDRLKLDTANLTKKEYKEYEKDLQRQQDKKDKELNEVRVSGSGLQGAIGELKNAGKNIKENLIEPISRTPENYKIGQLNEQLGLEAYKKMEGKKNNYDEIKKQVDNYNKFNQDIVNSNNLFDQNTQNLPNQLGALKSGIKGGGIGGVIGAGIGGIAGMAATKNPTGTLASAGKGAKLLGGSGYVAGQSKYTYELESGYQYQTLLDMGVPDKIAKDEAKKVGTVNALIESGESILDLVTLGKASQAKQLLTDNLVKKYGLQTVKDWTKNAGVSYTTNIISEGIEEGLQEKTSIESEKRASEKAGVERDDSKDLQRIKDSAIAGSFGALVTGGVTRVAGVVANQTFNKLTNKPIQNQQNKTNFEQSIVNDIDALNLGQNSVVVNENASGNINDQNMINSPNIGINNTTNTAVFSKQVDEVMNGTYPKRDMLVVSQNTPKIIQELGVKDLPITMTQKHLDTIVNKQGNRKNVHYHDLGVDLVKQIPEALSRPLNILQSDTKDNSIVVVTDLADNQERPIIASIEINGKGTIQDIRIDSNVMTSAYGRNNYDNFMQNNIAKGNLLYDIDEGIIKQKRDNIQGLQLPNEVIPITSAKDRVQFPMRGSIEENFNSDIPKNTSSFSANNISQSDKNVKSDISIANNMQLSENDTIRNEKNIPNELYENKTGDDVLVIKDNSTTKETNKISEEIIEDKTATLLNKRPEKTKKNLKEQFRDTLQKTVNKGYYVDKLAEKTGNKELTYKYDKMLSSQGEGHYSIGVAQTDNNGKKIGKSIIDIWKPVEKANKVQEFSDYLLHRHNIDRYEQGKPVFGDSITGEMSIEKVNEYEKSNPKFKEWAKDINTYNKNNLRNMVEAGLTSAETEEYLNNIYSNYIRINRDIKNGDSPIQQTSKGIKVNSPLKKAKGGNQDILPLKDSMAEQTLAIKNAIRRNQFGLELLNTLNTGENIEYNGTDYTVKDSNGENSFVNKTNDGKYYFTVYKDGSPIRMEIDEGLYEGIKPSKKSSIEDTLPLKAIQKASSWQRNVLTINNPLFIATNFFKDLGDAPLNSKYSSKFAKNYIKAVKEITTKGELYNIYMANGGSQNTYFDYDKGVKPESNNKFTKFVKKINNINEAVEQAPRLAEFISTIEAGGSLTEAMYNAAEITTNFKRGGELTKALNRNGANFLNASVQGFDKQIRNFSKQKGAKGYVNILAKATIFGVLPSVLNDLMFSDDDEEYEDLPEYIKDSYFLFKTDAGKFIRIPKGRVTSIFGSAARRTLNSIKGKEDAWDGFTTQTINQVAPNNPLEDNVFAPLMAISNNRSWNGSEIVPQRLQNQLEKNQYDEKTDAISKWLGGKLNISPKKINYLLDQYTGGIGDIGLPLITPQARQNPLSAKFTTDSVLNNKNVSIFYDTADQLTKKKNGDNAKDSDVLAYKYMNSKKLALSDLYKEKREIQNDTKLSNKKKYDKVRKKQKEINNFVKESLSEYKNVEINDGYAIVGEFKYKKDKNGKWIKQRSK